MAKNICSVSKDNIMKLPKGIMEEINLEAGTAVFWKVSDGKIIGSPINTDELS